MNATDRQLSLIRRLDPKMPTDGLDIKQAGDIIEWLMSRRPPRVRQMTSMEAAMREAGLAVGVACDAVHRGDREQGLLASQRRQRVH